jgi:hypothetical protein
VPLFGYFISPPHPDLTCSHSTSPSFPSTCLSPDQPGYGQLVPNPNGRRRNRRATQTAPFNMNIHHEPQANWTVVTPASGFDNIRNFRRLSLPHVPRQKTPLTSQSRCDQGFVEQTRRSLSPPMPCLPPDSLEYSSAPSHIHSHTSRYCPYPDSSLLRLRSSTDSLTHDVSESPAQSRLFNPRGDETKRISLPPIRYPLHLQRKPPPAFALPPISTMEDMRDIASNDSAAVLRRLQLEDNECIKGRPPLGSTQQ